MCTYSISVNDTLMEDIRPAFPNEDAVGQWLQSQVDLLLMDFARRQKQNTPGQMTLSQRLRGIATASIDGKKTYRHKALCGILNTEATEDELLEEYLQEKYHL